MNNKQTQTTERHTDCSEEERKKIKCHTFKHRKWIFQVQSYDENIQINVNRNHLRRNLTLI